MRNIKFRIWDKVNKLFIYMDHVTIKAHNLNKYTDGKIRLGLELGYTNYDCPVVETIPRYQDDYIVQISTGIKDKNGKEIYEGDIIKYGKFLFIEDSVVIYETKEVKYIESHAKFNIYDIKFKELDHEIIGNIFEGTNETN